MPDAAYAGLSAFCAASALICLVTAMWYSFDEENSKAVPAAIAFPFLVGAAVWLGVLA